MTFLTFKFRITSQCLYEYITATENSYHGSKLIAIKSTPKITQVTILGISSKGMGVYFFLRFLDCHDLLIRKPSLKSIHSRILQLLWPTYVSPSDCDVKSLERLFFSSLTEVLSFHRFPSQKHMFSRLTLFSTWFPPLCFKLPPAETNIFQPLKM